jgi:hypothetical protein
LQDIAKLNSLIFWETYWKIWENGSGQPMIRRQRDMRSTRAGLLLHSFVADRRDKKHVTSEIATSNKGLPMDG